MDCGLQGPAALQLPQGSARAAPRASPSSQARLGSAHALGQAAVTLRGRAAAERRAARAVSSRGSRRAGPWGARAAAEDASSVGGPLAPESPSGQLLRELMQSHPHLVPSAAEKQLEILAEQMGEGEKGGEGEGKEGKEGGAADKKTGSDLVLYKRIEEMRKRERQRGIEEVIYSLIVQRFIESGSPLLPKVPFVSLDASSPLVLGMVAGGIPSVRTNAPALEAVHSPEVLEMVQEHLGRVLGGQSGGIPGGPAMEDKVLVGTSKMRLGQVYAASIMYGYFLRRVDQRFQLEKGMQLLLGGAPAAAAQAGGDGAAASERLEAEKRARSAEFQLEGEGEEGGEEGSAKVLGTLNFGGFAAKAGEEKAQSPLRAYVSSFDPEMLQNAVMVRSREGVTVVERHTEALFGKPEVIATEQGVGILKDDQTHVTVSTLRRLILEAVAFGNFLWDVETYVDSHCKINARS